MLGNKWITVNHYSLAKRNQTTTSFLILSPFLIVSIDMHGSSNANWYYFKNVLNSQIIKGQNATGATNSLLLV